MAELDSTDCRSEEGILVGLVDGIIAAARVVARTARLSDLDLRDGLRHALADLSADEDIALLTDARWSLIGELGVDDVHGPIAELGWTLTAERLAEIEAHRSLCGTLESGAIGDLVAELRRLRQVQMTDCTGKVVVIRGLDGELPEAFSLEKSISEAGAELVIALGHGVSLDALDADDMTAAGWVRHVEQAAADDSQGMTRGDRI